MYEDFYGFREQPFSMVPNPDFLFLSRLHRAALNMLEYGLRGQASFTLISGEVGSGKTILVRRFLRLIGDRATVGVITNTPRNKASMLEMILLTFGLEYRGKGYTEQHETFMRFLESQRDRGRQTVLIIDEAHNLDTPALEELRMLSNINVDKTLVLQIVLVGQQEIIDTLKRKELRQLAQRIAVNFKLLPLNFRETRSYIRHRIRHAGGSPDIFDLEACATIFLLSGGLPRLINALCNMTLVYGFGEARKILESKTVIEVANDAARGGLARFPGVNKDFRPDEIRRRVKALCEEFEPDDEDEFQPEPEKFGQSGPVGAEPERETPREQVDEPVPEPATQPGVAAERERGVVAETGLLQPAPPEPFAPDTGKPAPALPGMIALKVDELASGHAPGKRINIKSTSGTAEVQVPAASADSDDAPAGSPQSGARAGIYAAAASVAMIALVVGAIVWSIGLDSPRMPWGGSGDSESAPAQRLPVQVEVQPVPDSNAAAGVEKPETASGAPTPVAEKPETAPSPSLPPPVETSESVVSVVVAEKPDAPALSLQKTDTGAAAPAVDAVADAEQPEPAAMAATGDTGPAMLPPEDRESEAMVDADAKPDMATPYPKTAEIAEGGPVEIAASDAQRTAPVVTVEPAAGVVAEVTAPSVMPPAPTDDREPDAASVSAGKSTPAKTIGAAAVRVETPETAEQPTQSAEARESTPLTGGEGAQPEAAAGPDEPALVTPLSEPQPASDSAPETTVAVEAEETAPVQTSETASRADLAAGETGAAETQQGPGLEIEALTALKGAPEAPPSTPVAIANVPANPTEMTLVAPASDLPVAPEPSRPQPPAADLAASLASDEAGGYVDAFKMLFGAWDLDYAKLAGTVPCQKAFIAGLSCYERDGSLNKLQRLNMPAIVELKRPSGELAYAVITGMDKSRVTLRIGGATLTVPFNEVAARQNGPFLLLWKSPIRLTENMGQGSAGENVAWLRRRLDAIMPESYRPGPGTVFDSAVRRSVRQFQRDRGLYVDGIVGAETLIALQKAFYKERIPALE